MEMSTTTTERLTAKLRLAMPPTTGGLGSMWEGGDVRATYVEYLRVMHGIVRASVPLMLVGVETCLRRPDDPVASALGSYLGKHIREEYGHDDWVAEDYQTAGGDPGELRDMTVGGAVAGLVGAQYYWVRHVHPVALLGYIAVLEGFPPAVETVDHLAARSGLPRSAFQTLERHAVLDQRHRADLHRVIDSLPLESHHETLIGVSALHTAAGIRQITRDLSIRAAGDGRVPAGAR
ncbi:iron-containing redox enzyme family protein [Phytohabitans flavus]